MGPNDNRRPGVVSRSGGYDGSNNSTNVIPLSSKIHRAVSPFDQLTAQMILAQHRAGTLPEAIVAALLAGVGLRP